MARFTSRPTDAFALGRLAACGVSVLSLDIAAGRVRRPNPNEAVAFTTSELPRAGELCEIPGSPTRRDDVGRASL